MSQLARPLRQAAVAARLSRHLSTTVPAAAAASDPIQKLFLDKLREYGSKGQDSQGRAGDPTPQLEAEMKGELERIGRVYGFQPGEDTTKFPTFAFPEPQVDPINAKN